MGSLSEKPVSHAGFSENDAPVPSAPVPLPGAWTCGKVIGVEIVVREARGGTVRYWWRVLFSLNPVVIWTADEDRDAPTVLARSASGTEYVSSVQGSYDKRTVRPTGSGMNCSN